MRKSLSAIALAFIVLATAPRAHADDPQQATADPHTEPQVKEEMVVTASAIEEPLSAVPAAATVITREQIEQRGSEFAADALREVPGVFVSSSGSPGKSATLFTRGGNSTQTLVMQNGVEVINPYFSGFNWGDYSTVGVERIEVVRGPYSALYGSDAMTGVINIITSSPDGIRFAAEGGENGLLGGRFEAGGMAGPVRVEAALEHRDDDGFYPNDDFKQDTVSAGADWSAGNLRVKLDARYREYELGIPFNTSADGSALVPSLSRRQDGNELQFSVPIEQQFAAASWSLTLSQNDRSDSFEDPDDPWGLTWSRTDSTTRRAHLVGRWDSGFGTVLAGGEWERAEVDDVTAYGANLTGETRTAESAFLEDRWGTMLGGAARLELSAGVRLDDFDTFGRETSPRVSGAVIDGSNKYRAAWGKGFRAPSIGELYFPFFGNAELDPERSTSWEAGYERLWRSGSFSVAWFENDFDNLIVYDQVTSRFANTGEAKTRGIETAASRQLGAGFTAGFTWTWLETEEIATGEKLLRRPKNSGSVNLAWLRGRYTTVLAVRYAGERDDLLPVYPYSRTINPSYAVADLRVSAQLRALRPFVALENATDEQYEEVLGYPSPGRRLLIGVTYSLK